MMRSIVVAVMALLILGGCADDRPDPPSPTRSAAATPTPPPMPELARDDSPAGAEAFVRHYIDVLNYAALTGDTGELKELSDPECEGCQSYIETIDQLYSGGGYIKDERWLIQDLEHEDTPSGVDVYVSVNVSESRFRRDKKQHEETGKTYTDSLRISTRQDEGGWVVQSFVRAKA